MVKKAGAGVDWELVFSEFARITIQVQMKKRDLGYREFTDLFNARYQCEENERNMRNKIARGTFSAAFFLMCITALECKSLDISPEDYKQFMR
jgi:hypothetical protein